MANAPNRPTTAKAAITADARIQHRVRRVDVEAEAGCALDGEIVAGELNVDLAIGLPSLQLVRRAPGGRRWPIGALSGLDR
jgi:hypothetical protein